MTRTLIRQYLVRKQEKMADHENGSSKHSLHNAATENFSQDGKTRSTNFKQPNSESHPPVTGHNGMVNRTIEVRNAYLKH